MTVTRIWQAHGEFASYVYEWTGRTYTAQVSTSRVNTGNYSFWVNAYHTLYQDLSASYDRFRFGCFFNRDAGANMGNRPPVFRLGDPATMIGLYLDGDGPHFEFVVDGVVRGTIAENLIPEDVHTHLGIDAKIGPTGFVALYIDGVERARFDGATNTVGTGVSRITIGSGSTLEQYNSTLIYFDDLFFDDLSGEPNTPAPVPDIRFAIVTANGDGYSSGWQGSDGDQINNYQQALPPPNGDTSYVSTTVAGNTDAYTMTDYTVPNGYDIRAVHPYVVARKLDAGSDVQIQLLTREASVNKVESAQAVGTSYGVISARQTSPPGGGTWNQAKLNAAEVGFTSAGAF